MSTAASARCASRVSPGPTCMPVRRRSRTKWATLAASVTGERLRGATRDPGEVVLVLQQHAERGLDGRRVELDRAECDEGVAPVEGFGDPGQLEQVGRAQLLNERDDLAAQ